MMKKRGEFIISHTVAYLLLVVIVAAIFIMGYRYFKSTKDVIKSSELLAFQNKLSNDVRSISSDYGTFKKIVYNLPDKLGEVCFVDFAKKDEILTSLLIKSYPTIKDGIEGNQDENVYLIGNVQKHGFNAGSFEVNHYPYFSCLPVNKGKIEIGLEGRGNKALVLPVFVSTANLDASRQISLSSVDDVITLIFAPGTGATRSGERVETITIEMIDPTTVNLNYGGSDIYKFEPAGTSFSKPVKLLVKYNPGIVGDCPAQLNFYQFDAQGNNRIANPSTSIDCKNKIAEFEINVI